MRNFNDELIRLRRKYDLDEGNVPIAAEQQYISLKQLDVLQQELDSLRVQVEHIKQAQDQSNDNIALKMEKMLKCLNSIHSKVAFFYLLIVIPLVLGLVILLLGGLLGGFR